MVWNKHCFQGAMNAWNPVIKIGEQIREAIREHYQTILKENTDTIQDLFKLVGLDSSILIVIHMNFQVA